MQCNQCGSRNTQRLPLVYARCTSVIDTVTEGWRYRSHTQGTSQTLLGSSAAPPAKRRYSHGILLLMLSPFLMILGKAWIYAVVMLMLAGVLALFEAVIYNFAQWPEAQAQWDRSWFCHKCGSIYR